MTNVLPFPNAVRIHLDQRITEPISHETFCTLLEDANNRETPAIIIGGMTIIHLPMAIAICFGDHCILIRQPHFDMDRFIKDCLAKLDQFDLELEPATA